MDKFIAHDQFVVVATAEEVEVDTFACVDSSGQLVAATASAAITVIGVLNDSVTGDGALKAQVLHGRCVLATNSALTALTAADIGGPCYIEGPETVSGDNTDSEAGTVLGFIGGKVMVKVRL